MVNDLMLKYPFIFIHPGGSNWKLAFLNSMYSFVSCKWIYLSCSINWFSPKFLTFHPLTKSKVRFGFSWGITPNPIQKFVKVPISSCLFNESHWLDWKKLLHMPFVIHLGQILKMTKEKNNLKISDWFLQKYRPVLESQLVRGCEFYLSPRCVHLFIYLYMLYHGSLPHLTTLWIILKGCLYPNCIPWS